MPGTIGSCTCGDYTFEYTGDPYDVNICNCIPCRKTFAFSSVTLLADKKHFKQLSGEEITAKSRVGDSGKPVTNHVCSKCFCVVYIDPEIYRPVIVLNAGLFDDKEVLDKMKPKFEVYCRNRPTHFAQAEGVQHIAGSPLAEQDVVKEVGLDEKVAVK